MDLDKDLEYDQLSEAVRRYAAERLYNMIQALQPHVDNLFESDPNALGYMEPARIAVQTQVAKLYVSSVKELGGLYRVNARPEIPEPEVEMIPAEQVPLMIEAAVDQAVHEAVVQVREELEAQRQEVIEIKAQEAKQALDAAIARVRQRQ